MNFRPSPLRFAVLLVAAVDFGPRSLAAQEAPGSSATSEKRNVEAALQETSAAAALYEFQTKTDGLPLVLRQQPILRWSNPEVGQIYGNVFLWTEGGRPRVVGSLFRWFSPHTHTSHEFQSLSTTPVTGRNDGVQRWKTSDPGVVFAPVPEAGDVAEEAGRRLLQMRELARQFAVQSTDREGQKFELRRLAQPVYRYEVDPSATDLVDGALFAFVRGTDPETWLLLEARRTDSGSAIRWEYALARMNSIAFSATYKGQPVWRCDVMPFPEVGAHQSTYTSFLFRRP